MKKDFLSPGFLFQKERLAQGLPMSFIVIAIMVILVLVIVVLIFFSGASQTQTFDRQTAVNLCDGECLTAIQRTKGLSIGDFTGLESGFCKKSFDLKGETATKTCPQLVSCELVFKDGTCPAICSGNTITCQTTFL